MGSIRATLAAAMLVASIARAEPAQPAAGPGQQTPSPPDVPNYFGSPELPPASEPKLVVTGSFLIGGGHAWVGGSTRIINSSVYAAELGALHWFPGEGPRKFLGATLRGGFDLGSLPASGDFSLLVRGGLGVDGAWRASFASYGFAAWALGGPVLTRDTPGFRVGLAGRIPLKGPLFGRGSDNVSVSSYDNSGLGMLIGIAEVILLTLNTVELAVETLYPPGQQPFATFTVSFGYGF